MMTAAKQYNDVAIKSIIDIKLSGFKLDDGYPLIIKTGQQLYR